MRFGQCTRYLAGLKPGDKVMTSVKPSVMKVRLLPVSPPFQRNRADGSVIYSCLPRPPSLSSWLASVLGELGSFLPRRFSFTVADVLLCSAAPFRAFLQERQFQKEQGMDVGELLYYFGSRYSSKEFLYGCVFVNIRKHAAHSANKFRLQ